MNGNKVEENSKENSENEYSSFRVLDLLLAIEQLTTEQTKPYSGQKHVAKPEKALLLISEKPTTNQSHLIIDEKSMGYRTIGSGSTIKCPQRSTFECNMSASKMYKNPQTTQKSKLVYNWFTKPEVHNQADRGIKQPTKMIMVNSFDRPLAQSLSIPFSQKKSRKNELSLNKAYSLRSPFLNIKLSPFRLHIQQSSLTGALRHEPFIDLMDLQLKLYKRSMSRRASEVVTEKSECLLKPIPIGRKDQGALPVPLICKGNKYIEKF